jgi:hypothetical protein
MLRCLFNRYMSLGLAKFAASTLPLSTFRLPHDVVAVARQPVLRRGAAAPADADRDQLRRGGAKAEVQAGIVLRREAVGGLHLALLRALADGGSANYRNRVCRSVTADCQPA